MSSFLIYLCLFLCGLSFNLYPNRLPLTEKIIISPIQNKELSELPIWDKVKKIIEIITPKTKPDIKYLCFSFLANAMENKKTVRYNMGFKIMLKNFVGSLELNKNNDVNNTINADAKKKSRVCKKEHFNMCINDFSMFCATKLFVFLNFLIKNLTTILYYSIFVRF